MQKTKVVLFILGFFCLVQISRAQFDTQSPYSYYGIGIPMGNTLQNGFAMGGVSHALRDSACLNYYNPASYSSIDVTQLNFGFEGNFLTRIDQGQTFRNNNVLINQFGLGIPLMHKNRFLNWGMFLGYAPYAQVGYRLEESDSILINPNDTSKVLAVYRYTGTGGLNRLTWGNGFQFGKNFSLGFNFHYIFGTSNRSRTLDLPASQGYLSSRVDEKTRVNAFSFDIGAQGYFNIKRKRYTSPRRITIEKKDENGKVISRRDSVVSNDKRSYDFNAPFRFIIGGTFNYGSSFNADFEQLGIQYLSGSFNVPVDTFLLNPNQTGNITLPHGFGGGFALVNPRIWQVTADFNYRLWNDFRYFDQPGLVFNNSLSVHVGSEYTPYFSNRDSGRRRFFKNLVFRLGGRYQNRFYQPDGNPVDEVAVSFGLGLPFGFEKSYDVNLTQKIIVSHINLGFEGGFANSRNNGVVNETFFRFSISIALRDKWFRKFFYN